MLLHGDEADAFALLSALCDCLMPGYHTPTMAGLHAGQQAFLSMLTEYVPRVARKLLANNVPVREQLTSWLLCCYIDALPLDATLRVWDLLFLNGDVALLRTAVAAFALHERVLLRSTELFDLNGVLVCDAGELIAASLAPDLQRCATDILAAAAQVDAKRDEAQAAAAAQAAELDWLRAGECSSADANAASAADRGRDDFRSHGGANGAASSHQRGGLPNSSSLSFVASRACKPSALSTSWSEPQPPPPWMVLD